MMTVADRRRSLTQQQLFFMHKAIISSPPVVDFSMRTQQDEMLPIASYLKKESPTPLFSSFVYRDLLDDHQDAPMFLSATSLAFPEKPALPNPPGADCPPENFSQASDFSYFSDIQLQLFQNASFVSDELGASNSPYQSDSSFASNVPIPAPAPSQRDYQLHNIPPIESVLQRPKVTMRKRTMLKLMDESDSDIVEGPTEKHGSTAIASSDKSKKRRSFNPAVKEFLIRWLKRYKDNPYPSPRIKTRLAQKTGLTVNQIEDFLVNGIQ